MIRMIDDGGVSGGKKATWRDGGWINANSNGRGNRPRPPTIRPSAGTPTDQLRSYVKSQLNLNQSGRDQIDRLAIDIQPNPAAIAQKYGGNRPVGGFYGPINPIHELVPKRIVVTTSGSFDNARQTTLHEAGHALDDASRRFVGVLLPRQNSKEFINESIRISEWLPEMQKAVIEAASHPDSRYGIDADELLAYVIEYVRPEFLPPSYIQKYLPSRYMNERENYHDMLRAAYDTRRPLRQERAWLEAADGQDTSGWREVASWNAIRRR